MSVFALAGTIWMVLEHEAARVVSPECNLDSIYFLVYQSHRWGTGSEDENFTSIFGKRQASRLHCLRHIKSSSYNLDNLKITTGLKDNISLNKDIMVVCDAEQVSLYQLDGIIFAHPLNFL